MQIDETNIESLYAGTLDMTSSRRNPISPSNLAKLWRNGDADDRAMVERIIDRLEWDDHFYYTDLYRDGRQMLIARMEPDQPRNADASLPLRLAGGVRVSPVRQLNDRLIAKLTGPVPVSEARLREIEALYVD